MDRMAALMAATQLSDFGGTHQNNGEQEVFSSRGRRDEVPIPNG